MANGLLPLQTDVEWYLYKQIFPPVERLCAPIDGTDAVRLADCLGLDTRKYQLQTTLSSQPNAQEIFPLESQLDDETRFQSARRLSLRCRFCTHTFTFHGLVPPSSSAAPEELCITPHGLRCPNPSCHRALSTLSIACQVEHQIRQESTRYYDGWLVCDDAACGNRTRQLSVYGHRCLGPRGHGAGCLGRMRYEYSEKQMYNQLLYWQSLWDVDKAKRKVLLPLPLPDQTQNRDSHDLRDQVLSLAEHNRARFATLKAVLDRYLDKCGRQWVAMDSLFGFLLR